MATQFQQLGIDDTDRLAQHLVAWHRAEGHLLAPCTARREARRILADRQHWHAWLIENRDGVIGYLVLGFPAGHQIEVPRARISALFVAPEARGQGVGRQAVRFIADLARWLQVRLTNADQLDEDRHIGRLIQSVTARPMSSHSPTHQAIA